MTETDIEQLKRLNEAWQNGKRYYGVGDVAEQLPAIIAVLEAARDLTENFMFDVRAKAAREEGYGVIHRQYVDALCTALQGRNDPDNHLPGCLCDLHVDDTGRSIWKGRDD